MLCPYSRHQLPCWHWPSNGCLCHQFGVSICGQDPEGWTRLNLKEFLLSPAFLLVSTILTLWTLPDCGHTLQSSRVQAFMVPLLLYLWSVHGPVTHSSYSRCTCAQALFGSFQLAFFPPLCLFCFGFSETVSLCCLGLRLPGSSSLPAPAFQVTGPQGV